MKRLADTHGVQFELVRHFLRRMFDGEWSRRRASGVGGDRRFSLFLPAGLLLVREGTPVRITPPNIACGRPRAGRTRCAPRRRRTKWRCSRCSCVLRV